MSRGDERWIFKLLTATAVVLIVTIGLGAEPVDSPVRATVAIRLYNNAGISARHLDAAREAAQSLLRQAGLQSVWRVCRLAVGKSVRSSVACDDVLGRAEVIVRIFNGGLSGDASSLGYSYVDMQTGTGSLTTVFANRVQSVAASARIEPGVLLGRVVAHEVGHLLRGRSSHSLNGLMRSHWPNEILRRNSVRDWQFSQNEATELREAVIARLH